MCITRPINMDNLVQETPKWYSLHIPHNLKDMMYGEHPNGGMTEIDPCNIDFPKDEFQSLVKSRRMSNCLRYSKTSNHLSVRGRIWTLTKYSMPPISEMNKGDLSTQENAIRPQSPVLEHAVSPHV